MPHRPYLPYVAPFVVYMAFLLVEWLWKGSVYLLYPIKTLAVAAALLYFRRSYSGVMKVQSPLFATFVGVVVLAIWVSPLSEFTMGGKSSGFNPYQFKNDTLAYVLIFFRITGASLIVPVMEELFWRGFLIRWIIKPEFEEVPLGQFSWLSFAVTTALFGVEHHHWLVGVIAGAIYNGVLYRTKALFPCILAHAVTNLGLGIYVLIYRQWHFW